MITVDEARHLNHVVWGGEGVPISGDRLAQADDRRHTNRAPSQRRGLTAGTRFRTAIAVYEAAHYVVDGDYVHGACLEAFLFDQYRAAGGHDTYPEGFDPDLVWEHLVEEGAWTPESIDMIEDNANPESLSGLEACVRCGQAIFLPSHY